MSISNNDLQAVIRKSLKLDRTEQVNESLVSQEKVFKLTTEFQSQSTKTAHIALYQKYIESFNRVSSELDTVNRLEVNSNSSQFRSLKQDETYNMNAIYLHELYFANISDIHSNIAMDSLSYMRLARDFGDFDKWQADFIACALSARCGWAVTYFNMYTQTYMNAFIDLHDTHVPVGCIPVVVMDVWQHSYYRDYLSDVKTFTYAMMKELNWEIIESRIKKTEKIASVMRTQ